MARSSSKENPEIYPIERHARKWICDGGIVMSAVYQHHLNDETCTCLAKNSRALPQLNGSKIREGQLHVVSSRLISSQVTDVYLCGLCFWRENKKHYIIIVISSEDMD